MRIFNSLLYIYFTLACCVHAFRIVLVDPETLLSMDDPFGYTGKPSVIPPPLIFDENNTKESINPYYAVSNPQVTIPREHRGFAFFVYEIESSNPGKVVTMNRDDVTVKSSVSSIDTQVITRASLKAFGNDLFRGRRVIVGMRCRSADFGILKECESYRFRGFTIFTTEGQFVARNGVVNDRFNAHNRLGGLYVSHEDEGTKAFMIRGVADMYTLTNATVQAFKAPESILKQLDDGYFAQAVTKPKDGISLGSPGLPLAKVVSKDGSIIDKVFLAFNESSETSRSSHVVLLLKHNYGVLRSLSKIPQASTSSVCKPVLSGEVMELPFQIKGYSMTNRISPKKETPNIGTLIHRAGSRLDVTYNCLANGVSLVEITLKFERKVYASNTVVEEARIGVLKVCAGEKVDDSDLNLMGFDVRLGAFIPGNSAFYAIRNGIISPSFHPKEHSLVVAPEEEETSFFVYINPDVWISKRSGKSGNVAENISIIESEVASQRRICMPYLFGHAAHGGTIGVQALPLVVKYNCDRSGKTIITLNFVLEVKRGSEARRMDYSFSWTKESSLVSLSTLNVRTMRPELFMNQLNLDLSTSGQSIHTTQVVERGSVLPAFSPSTLSYHLSESMSILALNLTTIAPFSNLAKREVTQALEILQPTIVSSSSICHVSIRNIADMEAYVAGSFESEGINEKTFSVTSASPVYLVIDHDCVGSGQSTITLTITEAGSPARVVIAWGKACSWKETKVSLFAAIGGVFIAFLVAAIITSIACAYRYKEQIKTIMKLKLRNGRAGYKVMNVKSSND